MTPIRLGAEDWRRWRQVRLRALADTPEAFGSTYDRESVQPDAWWEERQARRDVACFAVADPELGEDVGIAVGAPHHDLEGAAALYSMWVAPSHRRRGLGRALIEAVVEWARAEGYARLALDVADQNQAAVRAYAALGFEPTGRVDTLPPPRAHITEHERAREL